MSSPFQISFHMFRSAVNNLWNAHVYFAMAISMVHDINVKCITSPIFYKKYYDYFKDCFISRKVWLVIFC